MKFMKGITPQSIWQEVPMVMKVILVISVIFAALAFIGSLQDPHIR